MKNYMITSNEHDIAKRRLNRLKDRKEKLKSAINKITSTLQTIVADGGELEDKMSKYMADLEEVEADIKELEAEVKELRSDLDFMVNKIYDIKEIKYKVFYWCFINNKAPLKAAKLVPCGKSTIYRYIDEINEDRKSWEKTGKL